MIIKSLAGFSHSQVSESLKAFRGIDGRIRFFRPDEYTRRLINSTDFVALPKFDAGEYLQCLKKLVSVDRDWVPNPITSSLSIQTTIIGTEVFD